MKEPRPKCEDCFHARVLNRTVACAKGYWKGGRELFSLGRAPKKCTEFESMDGEPEINPRESPHSERDQ